MSDPAPYEGQRELILRDQLALDRTRLANERTLLAWLRTALMLVVSGGTVVKLFGDDPSMVTVGWVLIPLGVVVGAFGFYRFVSVHRRIRAQL